MAKGGANRESVDQGDSGSAWVEIRLPDRLNRGAKALAENCEWELKYRAGRPYFIPRERLGSASKPLLRLEWVAGGTHKSAAAWARLENLPPQDEFLTMPRSRIDEELRRLSEIGPDAAWEATRLLLGTAPDADVGATARTLFEKSIQPTLPDASLWVLRIDPVVLQRAATVRALFAAEETPELLNRPPDEFGGFEAGRELFASYGALGQSYIQPALLTTAPWLLGLTAERAGASIVVLFGDVQMGMKPHVSFLDLYTARMLGRADDAARQVPNLSPAETEAFVRWWVGRLNAVLQVVLDPTNFVDDAGVYDPRSHIGAQLTIERLFGCVQSLLAYTSRDDYVRKTLFFDALDLLHDGLAQGNYEKLARVGFVKSELERLRADLPQPVGRVALPRCEEAVKALTELQDGFHLHERINNQTISLRTKSGDRTEPASLERAAARYLNLLRNTTHGLRKSMNEPHNVSLFASHNGSIPNDVPDVAFLHLLRLVAEPGNFFRRRVKPA